MDGGNSYVDVWSDTQGRVQLSVREKSLKLEIWDKDRKPLMSLGVETVNEDPPLKRPGGRIQYLTFMEGAGQVSLGLHRDGSGGLAITQNEGKRSTMLWQEADGGPVLQVYDPEGKPIVQIPPR